MPKDPKMKRCLRRVAHILERSGFRVSFCQGILSEAFSISADSVYSPAKDVGIYIKVSIDRISKNLLDAIMNYQTPRKKELWILRRDESSSDPGTFLVFRFDGRKLIEHPENWPIHKVVSSPKKRQATPQK